mmetsp:Transcript_30125/g.46024  ORF Transcript_30125/g.46024 Transcript_30125/m.46024 type:complete len:225 (-) Transcript_30125:366-1040(-)
MSGDGFEFSQQGVFFHQGSGFLVFTLGLLFLEGEREYDLLVLVLVLVDPHPPHHPSELQSHHHLHARLGRPEQREHFFHFLLLLLSLLFLLLFLLRSEPRHFPKDVFASGFLRLLKLLLDFGFFHLLPLPHLGSAVRQAWLSHSHDLAKRPQGRDVGLDEEVHQLLAALENGGLRNLREHYNRPGHRGFFLLLLRFFNRRLFSIFIFWLVLLFRLFGLFLLRVS